MMHNRPTSVTKEKRNDKKKYKKKNENPMGSFGLFNEVEGLWAASLGRRGVHSPRESLCV